VTAAPNFAYEWAAQRGLPAQGDDIDLSNVVLIIGSEPVGIDAVTAFNKAFAPYGLPRTAFKPSYGIAEATLLHDPCRPPRRWPAGRARLKRQPRRPCVMRQHGRRAALRAGPGTIPDRRIVSARRREPARGAVNSDRRHLALVAAHLQLVVLFGQPEMDAGVLVARDQPPPVGRPDQGEDARCRKGVLFAG